MKRITKQRQAIMNCFAISKRPLSVEEILDMAGHDVPRLNLATVYRNLKILISEGAIAVVDLPGHNTRYEQIGLKHHHHFLCCDCNRLFDVEGCPHGIAALVPKGFKLTGHTITLEGHCKECVKDKGGLLQL